MIKELWKWVSELFVDFYTFEWQHLGYDLKNIYWYLKYGFTFSDIQDMDIYLKNKIADMLGQFIKYNLGVPFNSYDDDYEANKEKYNAELIELKELTRYINKPEFEDLEFEKQDELNKRFLELLNKHFFHLWF